MNTPHQSSLGDQIVQQTIFGISRVLTQENSVGRSVSINRHDLTTGSVSLSVGLWLPKVIEIAYVQSAENWLNTLDPKSLKAQMLEFIKAAISDVLEKASIKAKVVFIGFRDETCTARFQVALDDLEIVKRQLLPRVINIEYI